MLLFALLALLSFVGLVQNITHHSGVAFQPEQIHLAYGDNVDQFVITWSTFDQTDSIVQYGIGGLILTATGTSRLFVDGGPKKHQQYIHRVVLTGLTPNSKYEYHCGSPLAWSEKFYFLSPPAENWQPHFAIFGDMGVENAQSLGRLTQETQWGMYDAILHVGDFAYDMDTDDASVGDLFMRQIQPMAAYIPYMTCPGNHEQNYNFSNYLNRFAMPGSPDALMYSIDIGPIHLVSISTEVYYFIYYGLKPLVFQYEWLVEDLTKANANREQVPWIVLMGHRPMYCSDADRDDCTRNTTFTRIGLPFLHFFPLEQLMYEQGVDVLIWAHEHSYERLWPVYNERVMNGSYDHPYVNPRAPVHIVTGSAGCKEDTDPFIKNRQEWSAFVSSDYGYTRMKVYNASHLHFEQVSINKTGMVIDDIWVIKDHHGPFTPLDQNEFFV